MNAKHISFAFAAAAALIAGCAKNPIEEAKSSGQLTDLELSHVGSTEVKSVINGTDFPQTGEIGLFLFKDETATKAYGDGYENVRYAYNSTKGRWTASPSIKVGSTPGYLYGYYPYKESNTNVKAIPVSSSVNGDDVMYASKQAEPITDATAANTAITMNHALARVSITIVNKGYTGDAKLTKIKFYGAEIAPTGTLNALDGKITAEKDEVSLDVTGEAQTITAAGTTYECLLVPSKVETNRQAVTLTLTIDDIAKEATLSGDDNGVIFAKGTKSNIAITLSNKGISVQTVSVEDWKEVEVGGHKVTVKLADDVTPHDILTEAYVDGNNVIIRALSNAGQHLNCTLPGGVFCPQSKTDKLVYTFTLSDIESDVTATIGYAKTFTVNALSNNTEWGTVSFEGECYEGETITFKATELKGIFVEWQDAEGKTLSKNNPYSVTLTSDLTVKAVFDIYGVLPGVFTVVDKPKKTVLFSKGNLYWDGSGYDFESKQYEFKDSWNENHVSHFYWSRIASVAYAQSYNSSGSSTGDVFFTNKEDFSVGTAPAGAYNSLSADEWRFLIKSRRASTVEESHNARYAKATIKMDESTSVPGLILFPDVFAIPEGVKTPSGINVDNAEFDTNIYTVDDWSKLESAGAVFLPAAGQRDNNDVKNVGIYGYYWSASSITASRSHGFEFNGGDVGLDSGANRSLAYSVRLVTECQSEPSAE